MKEEEKRILRILSIFISKRFFFSRTLSKLDEIVVDVIDLENLSKKQKKKINKCTFIE